MRIEGVADLKRVLPEISGEGRRTVQREMLRSLVNVQAGAKRRVRVRSGRLRNSIAVALSDDGMSGAVGTKVEYARREEMGFAGTDSLGRTYDQAAHPYLTPAAEEERAAFADRLQKKLNEAFHNVAKG